MNFNPIEWLESQLEKNNWKNLNQRIGSKSLAGFDPEFINNDDHELIGNKDNGIAEWLCFWQIVWKLYD